MRCAGVDAQIAYIGTRNTNRNKQTGMQQTLHKKASPSLSKVTPCYFKTELIARGKSDNVD